MRETQAPLAAALACRRRLSPRRTAVVGLYPGRQLIISELCSSMDWYMIQPEASMGNPPMWVPVTSLSSVGSGCN